MRQEDQKYAIRFRSRARLELDEARVRLAEMTDLDHAVEWYNGFLDSLATLTDNPGRHLIAHENNYFRDTVHVYTYRLTARGAAYQVYYTIVEFDQDAPFVTILHIRHGARKPMTRAEARKIDEDSQNT